MDLRHRGKRAPITGSSRGIFRAIAHSLANFGGDVAIPYLRGRTRAEGVRINAVSAGTVDTDALHLWGDDRRFRRLGLRA